MRESWLFFLSCFFACLFSCSFAHAEDPPIRIGILTDMSGMGAFFGKGTQISAEIMAQELREKGIPVKLIFQDSVLNPQKGIAGAQKLVLLEKVDVLWSDFSPVAVAISPFMKNSNTLLFYSGAAESILKSNPYSIKTFTDFDKACTTVAQYIKKQGISRVANLRALTEPGEVCFHAWEKVFPDTLVQDFQTGSDIRSQILSFKQKGVQAFVNTGYQSDIMNALKASQILHYHPLHTFLEENVTEDVRPLLAGNKSKVILFGFRDLPEKLKQKVEGHKAWKPGYSTIAAGMVFLHLPHIAQAVQACPTRDRTCIQENILRAAPEELLGFQGFKEREAILEIQLKKLNEAGEIVPIE